MHIPVRDSRVQKIHCCVYLLAIGYLLSYSDYLLIITGKGSNIETTGNFLHLSIRIFYTYDF